MYAKATEYDKWLSCQLIMAGKTVADMAVALNTHHSNLSTIVTGKRPAPARLKEQIDNYIDSLDRDVDSFEKKVRLALLERGMTMHQLQDELDVSRQALNCAVKDKKGYGKIRNRIVSYLDLSI